MSRLIDLTGIRFGKWTVLEKSAIKKAVTHWKCECECGVVKDISGSNLNGGKTRSCGCDKANLQSKRLTKDIAGNVYSKLLVVSKSGKDKHGKILWNCVCDCGNEVVVTGSGLKSGDTKSCGCLGMAKIKEIAGQRFGRYVAIEFVEFRKSIDFWLCKCDCGIEKVVSSKALISDVTKSCGCYNRELVVSAVYKHGKAHTREYYRELYRKFVSTPVGRLKFRVRSRVKSAIRNGGYESNGKTSEILGCSFEELKIHIERQFTKGMSWDCISKIHIDHIVPLDSARTEEDVLALCHFTNLRPVWASENLSKGAKREFLI